MIEEVRDIIKLGESFNLKIPIRTISEDEKMLMRVDRVGSIITRLEANIRPGWSFGGFFVPTDFVGLNWFVDGKLFLSKDLYGDEINECIDIKGRIRHK